MAVIVNGDGILTGISSLATALTDITSGRGTITGVTTVGTLQLGAGVSISSPRSQQAAIFTNNTEFLSVDDAGRVGVGTITPNSDAHPENEKKINVGFITAKSIAGDIDARNVVVAGISTFTGAIDVNSTSNFGGNLTVSSGNLTMSDAGNIVLGDSGSSSNDRIQIGSSQDLSLFHNGTHSFINNSQGTLVLQSDALSITNEAGNSNRLVSSAAGNLSLYFSDSIKLKTTGSGVDITDTLNVAGISTFLGNVNITGTNCLLNFTDTNNNSDFRIQVESGSFLIEDMTNSYADRLVILSNGHTIIGGASGSAGNRSQYAMLAVRGNNSSATGHGVLNLMSGANRSNTEEVSQIAFADPEGDYAWIQSFADNVTGSSDKPGRLTFSTTPDGGTVPTEKLRITNDGKVGINKINPESALHIAGPASGLMSRMRITCTDSGNHTFAVGADGSGSFQSTINNDRHIIYTTGTMRGSWTEHGLCFGTDDAAANGLNDYEEGTWTFAITPGGGSYQYNYGQTGYYRKIGNTVFINAWVHLIVSSAVSGSITLTGLPFACQNRSRNWIPVGGYGHASGPSSAGLWLIVTPNATTGSFYYNNTNYGAGTNLTAGNLGNSAELYINGSYFTDA